MLGGSGSGEGRLNGGGTYDSDGGLNGFCHGDSGCASGGSRATTVVGGAHVCDVGNLCEDAAAAAGGVDGLNSDRSGGGGTVGDGGRQLDTARESRGDDLYVLNDAAIQRNRLFEGSIDGLRDYVSPSVLNRL